jgi:isocitrate dehydrogenase
MIEDAIERTLEQKKVTYDLARHLGVEPLSTTDYTQALIDNL